MITLFLIGCMIIGVIWLGVSIVWAMAKFMIWIGLAVFFLPAIVLLTLTFA